MIPIRRRAAMQATAFSLAVGAALPSARSIARETRDVEWLAEVTTPPPTIPVDAPRPPSVLVAAGKPVRSLDAWRENRAGLRADWLTYLGAPTERQSHLPEYKVVDEHVVAPASDDQVSIVRKKIAYDSEPGWPCEAWLMHPQRIDGQTRAAVVFHPTVERSIDEPAGLWAQDVAPDGPRALALHLARQGWTTICPRNYLWPTTNRIDAQGESRRWLADHPDQRGMAKMLEDAQQAIDILVALDHVDAKRIAAVGHSLGAKEALYVLAFDERVVCAAASEGGIARNFSNWEAAWYLGEKVDAAMTHDHHQLLALAAPRPFLNIAGDSADGDNGWPLLERGQEIYRLYGEPVRLGQFNHHQGHPLNDAASRRMIAWLNAYI